jgi:inactivated superfamily I helicase
MKEIAQQVARGIASDAKQTGFGPDGNGRPVVILRSTTKLEGTDLGEVLEALNKGLLVRIGLKPRWTGKQTTPADCSPELQKASKGIEDIVYGFNFYPPHK